MSPEAVAVPVATPLTHLNEDEQLFRSAVRDFPSSRSALSCARWTKNSISPPICYRNCFN